ncbi:hypothetical protein C0585_07815 [Candidatus Woesearchaeota archaeon]|nr:MAG: hypothetical protein C0585_07815 [Candidatus Woesearchaeota archaeon]
MRIVHISTNITHPYMDIFIIRNLKENEEFIKVSYDNETPTENKNIQDLFLSGKYNKDVLSTRKLLSSLDLDLINIHVFSDADLLPILNAASSLGIKKVLTLHEYSLICKKGTLQNKGNNCDIEKLSDCNCEKATPKENKKRQFKLDLILSQIDLLLCFSKYQKKVLDRITNNVFSKKTKVVYHGIYPNFGKPKTKKTTNTTLGFIGTTSKIKGFQEFVKIVERFKGKDIHFKIALSKEQPLDKETIEKIKKIDITYDLKYDMMDEFYSSIDYIIIPSNWNETGPLTLYESVYFKTPLIIKNIPSMIEKVDKNYAHTYADFDELILLVQELSRKKNRYSFPIVKDFNEYNEEINKLYETIPPAKSLMLKTGYVCNNNCCFCSVEDNKPNRFISFKDIKKVLIEKRKEYGEIVFSNSGDATFHPDFFQILKSGQLLGYKMILFTNAKLISGKRFFDKIKKYELSYVISLTSHKARLHDELTGKKGNFDKTTKGLMNLVSIKADVTGRILIHKQNYKELKELADFFIKKNVDTLFIAFMTPVGGAKKRFDELISKYEDSLPYFNELIEYLDSKNVEYVFEGVPFCLIKDSYKKSLEYFHKNKNENYKGVYPKNKEDDYFINEGRQTYKVKINKCKICNLNSVCEGIYEEYIKNYGDEEFKPIIK